MHKHYYIGIATTFHDPAIAIVDETGEVLFAEASERYYQVKRANACPADNIYLAEKLINKYCSKNARFTISKSWSSRTEQRRKLIYNLGLISALENRRLKSFFTKVAGVNPSGIPKMIWQFKNQLSVQINSGVSIEKVINDQMKPEGTSVKAYDHHLSHAGFACYSSPFADATCLITDGSGEGGSFSLYGYKNGKITLLEKQLSQESLGTFYARLTAFCGFDPVKGEEWKVMGLAAYGSYNEHLYGLLSSMYAIRDCKLQFSIDSATTLKAVNSIHDIISSNAGDFTLRSDIAYNGQLAYSKWMNEMITNVHTKYPSDNLVLTGGCALNSSYNGQIINATPFKNLHVPSAPADDGNALGGALLAYYADHPHTESIHKHLSPYLGTEITEKELSHFLEYSNHGKVRRLGEEKYEVVAALIAQGKIVALMQGRAEYGPRALGNRSILADPRRKEIKDIINDRVKFREEFRPFAPAILHEYGHEYFDDYQESHYMERTLTFKKDGLHKVPGVIHKDNTGRLQTVKEEWNYDLYHLLKEFLKITGVPVLLNTSLNVMNKPMVHTVEDALSTFFTTGIDALVIDNYLIEK